MAAALAMAAVMAWNLDRGFSTYLDARDAQLLDDFVADLEARLLSSGTLRGEVPSPQSVALAVREIANDGGISDLPRRPPARLGPDRPAKRGANPPRGRRGPPPPTFGHRLRISDMQGQLLFGPPSASDKIMKNSISRNVSYAGDAVATASLLPRGPTPSAIDTRFLRNQYIAMAGVTAFLLIGSGLSAWLFARAGARTIAAFQRATSDIAVGNFDTRMQVHGKDEFATLATNVNSMADNLQRLQSARRRWLAEISHELRTPLTVLIGELEALDSGIRPITMDAVHSLSEEARTLNRLIDDLHLLAVSDLGSMSTKFAQCDLIEMVQRTSARHASTLEENGLELDVQRGALTKLEVVWDAPRIDQLLGNLISNSIRYTDAPGRIRITLSATGDDAQLIVEDSAPGVPADQCGLLFEPLHRLEEARDRVSGGSGLGLSVAQAIVKAHGGEIWAGPSGLGGLAINVTIPITPGVG